MRTILGLASILTLASSACAPFGPSAARANVGLDAVAPPVRVERVRILARAVNVGRPLELDAEGAGLAIGYRSRSREDSRVVIDPVSLEPFAPLDPSETSLLTGFVPPTHRAQYLTLSGGRVLHCFMTGNVDYGYRLFVDMSSGRRALAVNGTPSNLFSQAAPVEVTPESSEVLGSIQAARVDDQHAVVAFYSVNRDEIDLMVARIEAL
jgi:hypothetical protein